MRILVMSDSHGNKFNVKDAVDAQREADAVIFLGDGEDDIDHTDFVFRNKRLFKVQGNCDFSSLLPYEETVTFDNVKIFITHGHMQNVKMGMEKLKEAAKEKRVQIALYGHTHKPRVDYVDGIYFMNPGTVGDGYTTDATYGTIDITNAGIFCNIVKLKNKSL